MPTDIGFTGQRAENASLGSLMFYQARYYSPYLNRLIQPDTIVPDPADPQSLNRYSYVLNNPLRYRDPTGHEGCSHDDVGACSREDLLNLLGDQLQLWNQEWMTGFLKYWASLLGQSETGALLIKALADSGFSMFLQFDYGPDTAAGDTVRLEGLVATVKIKFDWFYNDLISVLSGVGQWQTKLYNMENFNAYYAGVVGHELFHVAIGDENLKRSLGDNTGMAYRINAKIINELLYDNDVSNYVRGSPLTGEEEGKWKYYQAELGFWGATEFTRDFASNRPYFRVKDTNMVRALVALPVRSEPTRR